MHDFVVDPTEYPMHRTFAPKQEHWAVVLQKVVDMQVEDFGGLPHFFVPEPPQYVFRPHLLAGQSMCVLHVAGQKSAALETQLPEL